MLSQTLDANGQLTASFDYDPSGNLASTTSANGFTHSFGYDDNGNQANSSYTWTPPGGSPVHVSTYTVFDAQGQVTMTIDVGGNTKSYGYWPDGQCSRSGTGVWKVPSTRAPVHSIGKHGCGQLGDGEYV
jgi:uncharacterized protein RhaS with RHS repeats